MTHLRDNVIHLGDNGEPRRIQFAVPGNPAPQGSKRHVGRGILVEDSKKSRPWRNDVVDTIRSLELPCLNGPVSVEATFYLRRPKSHFGTGRNAGKLKESAPDYVSSQPDLDKLVRALLDAMVIAAVLRDDSQVAVLVVGKRYADTPGVRVTVRSLP